MIIKLYFVDSLCKTLLIAFFIGMYKNIILFFFFFLSACARASASARKCFHICIRRFLRWLLDIEVINIFSLLKDNFFILYFPFSHGMSLTKVHVTKTYREKNHKEYEFQRTKEKKHTRLCFSKFEKSLCSIVVGWLVGWLAGWLVLPRINPFLLI